VFAPRREHDSEAFGREKSGQGVTKPSGRSDENGGGRIAALIGFGAFVSGSVTGSQRGICRDLVIHSICFPL
jgi:hypothetical protein